MMFSRPSIPTEREAGQPGVSSVESDWGGVIMVNQTFVFVERPSAATIRLSALSSSLSLYPASHMVFYTQHVLTHPV